jgi:hypothetical protein
MPVSPRNKGDALNILFPDVDGVLSLDGETFDPGCVAQLNRIIATAHDPCQIVFNSAWNIHGVDVLRAMLVASGFEYPECIIGRTSACCGGGELARSWLVANGKVGTPYVILEDSTSHLGASWGRLAHCIPTTGLTPAVADKAIGIIQRGIGSRETESMSAYVNIMAENDRLRGCDWLTEEQRQTFRLENTRLALAIMHDVNFLRTAGLAP